MLFAVLLGLTAGINGWIDAHGIYRQADTDALSRLDQFWYMRSTKPLKLREMRPDSVILGSSRAGRITPRDGRFRTGYNASMPGATLYELDTILDYLSKLPGQRDVMIGLDFRAFSHAENVLRFGFEPALFEAPLTPGGALALVLAHKNLLLSNGALTRSVQAQLGHQAAHRARYHPDGSWYTVLTDEPPRKRFLRSSRQLLGPLREATEAPLEYSRFDALLHRCYDSRLRCQFFITPVHLSYLLLLSETSTLEQWKHWHHELAIRIARAADERSVPPLPLLAFNHLEEAVSEPMAVQQEAADYWFKDPIHFRPRFGVIIWQALNQVTQEVALQLNPANVDHYIARVSALYQRYDEQQRSDIDYLRARLELGSNDGLR